jgi:hypothetical protein
LIRLGIRGFNPKLRYAEQRLETLRTPEGEPIPANTLAELKRDMQRRRFIRCCNTVRQTPQTLGGANMSKTRGVAGRTPAILLPPETNRRHRPLPPITMPVRGAAYRVLTQEFIADLHEHWREHGKAALDACAERWPHVYVQIVAKLVQIHHIEVGGPGDFASAMNREQLLDKVGERFGQKGRDMFERFVAQLDRLRADAKGAAGG